MKIRAGEKPTFIFSKQILPPIDSSSAPAMIELGAGWCDFAAYCRDKGYRVSIADKDIGKIEKAKQLGFPAERLDLNNLLPYKDSSFDGCAMLEVIEHIVKAEDLVVEISRILKNDAFFILTTPNPAYYPFRLKALFGFGPREEGYHYRFFTKKRLIKLLRDGGFEIKIFSGFGYIPLVSGAMLKLKNYCFQFYIPSILQALFANRFVVLARNRKK
ncbi:MAG: methyltransferase domain-containing protein [Candidatus Omnitrophota bacterium]|nr:methyltransferase domain-containing protein [Candidatus Omnitrophota bacterium]